MDEYSLDGKATSKSDVNSFLESAGFSRANPYYIVPQGRVTSLTTAKDEDRLKLIKEIAGTRVYEQKRQESNKLIQETESKREKIDQVLVYIEDRLAELEAEKEELSEFQEIDKDRRAIEYKILTRESASANRKLDDLEEERRRHISTSDGLRESYAKNENTVQVSALTAAPAAPRLMHTSFSNTLPNCARSSETSSCTRLKRRICKMNANIWWRKEPNSSLPSRI